MPQGWDLEELGGVKSARPTPPKPLDEIQPNLVCALLTRMGHATAYFLPGGPGKGSKGHISLYFNYKVFFKEFLNQLCMSSHK